MKKTIVALSVMAAFSGSAFAQTNVTIYGVADAGLTYSDNGAADDAKTLGLDSGLQSGSRLGFRGTEELGNGLQALFVLESGFSIDNGAMGQGGRLFGRQSFVGLSGGFGAIKLGRQYNPIRPALESIDPFGLGLAGNISNVFDAHGERADNTINYSTPDLGGFSGQAAVSLGEIAGDRSAGRQWGVSGGYANGPIRAILAHHDRNLLSGTPATVPSGESRSTMLGGVYDFKVVKAHAAYAVNKGSAETGATTIDSRDMMLGISVPFGASTVLASYMRKNNEFIGNADSNVWALGYTYNLSKRTNFYSSYARIKNDDLATVGLGGAAVAGRDPSTFNVGVRHRF
jgi:predicted porin